MLGFIQIIIGVLVVAVLATVAYFKRVYSYWKKKNVPYVEPSAPWGTMQNQLKSTKPLAMSVKDAYDELKSKGHGYGGIYMMIRPVFLAIDPELIKKVLAKDFQHFIGHGLPVDEEKRPITGNLFNLEGDKWRNMRVKLTPTFTSGKMKVMFPTLLDCGVPMIDYIDQFSDRSEPLDIKEILSCFTTDVVGSCAFGIDCNSFMDPDAEFRKHGRNTFEMTWRKSLIQFVAFMFPKIMSLPSGDEETMHFFYTTFKNIANSRETSKQQRNDFVQLLLEIRRKGLSDNDGDVLTVQQMATQSILFFAAGFETSSTTMTFCLHELAHNLDIQQKLREEIIATMRKHDGKLTYDCVMEMKYLNMVLDETLRKYPPGGLLNRHCNKDYTIENTDVVIEAGTQVFVSVLGLHRDPEYFPNPEKFDPERFSDENKPLIHPYTYLPFGEGPRICIGLRFGLMLAKTGLCLLLKNYILTPHETMRYNMGFHKYAMVLSFEDTLLLYARRINSN